MYTHILKMIDCLYVYLGSEARCVKYIRAVLPNLFSTTAHLLGITHQTAHCILWHLFCKMHIYIWCI